MEQEHFNASPSYAQGRDVAHVHGLFTLNIYSTINVEAIFSAENSGMSLPAVSYTDQYPTMMKFRRVCMEDTTCAINTKSSSIVITRRVGEFNAMSLLLILNIMTLL